MSWITVGIAAADRTDPRRPLGDPASAVTDALADRHLAHGYQLRSQAHYRFQAQLGGTQVGKRGGAIKHDAGPQPVHVCGRNGQQGCRVGQAALVEIQIQQLKKNLHLLLDQRMAALVGTGEVAEQVQFGNLRRTTQARMGRTHSLRCQPQAVHAAIQLEPDIQRSRQ